MVSDLLYLSGHVWSSLVMRTHTKCCSVESSRGVIGGCLCAGEGTGGCDRMRGDEVPADAISDGLANEATLLRAGVQAMARLHNAKKPAAVCHCSHTVRVWVLAFLFFCAIAPQLVFLDGYRSC